MSEKNRLEMASLLLQRANHHRNSIGDDHGDPYEEALLKGSVPDEMLLLVKEIVEHLRSALDYCAMHLTLKFGAPSEGAKVYFPIARKGSSSNDFASLMNRNMPGVPKNCPQAFHAVSRFQEFASPDNVWLPELATLANMAKHLDLRVVHLPHATMRVYHSNDVPVMSFSNQSSLRRSGGLTLIKSQSWEGLEDGEYEVLVLQLREINVELSTFLREACYGVSEIVGVCQELTEQS